MTIVRQSVSVSCPIAIQTAIITATAAIFTASKNAEITLDCLILGTNGFNMATNTKEGRKIPTVAAIAPPQKNS